MTEPHREWEVFVSEHDGRESKSTFAEPVSVDPPYIGHGIIVDGRDLIIEEISPRHPQPGTVGKIKARPMAGPIQKDLSSNGGAGD